MVLCSEALKAYLIQKLVDGLSPRSIAFYEGKLSMFVAFVSDKPLRDLTLSDGQNWVLHLVPHQGSIDGYSRFSLMRASAVVKRQLTVARCSLRVFCQAVTSRSRVL